MSNDQEASVSNIELAADYKGTLGGAVLEAHHYFLCDHVYMGNGKQDRL